jgi:magnesium transporter
MSIASRDETELAANLATEQSADIVDLLNRNKPAFAMKLLQSLPEAQVVDALDQPELERSAAILSALPPERAARLLDLMSADRATHVVREMRISVRNELLARVSPETRASLDQPLPDPKGWAGHIMTTEFVTVPADWMIGEVLDHIRAVEHTRETVYAIYLIDPPTDVLLRAITLRQLIFADTGATVPRRRMRRCRSRRRRRKAKRSG